jgi:hypothetical protein
MTPTSPALSIYERFEALVAFVLTFVIGAVVVVALYRLIIGVGRSLVLESLNPLDHAVFQSVFGQIMTLLIAADGLATWRMEAPSGTVVRRNLTDPDRER